MTRLLLPFILLLGLAACGAEEEIAAVPEPLADFRLGHNIAIADETQRGPFSRAFTEDELEAALQGAVAERLRRYDGDGLYHLGMNVGGLVLAQPGIPLIYAPSSTMIVDVTVFDNRTQSKLNEEPKRFIVGEGIRNAVPIIGSGLTRDAETQLANLSTNAARQIEAWLRENPEWFTVPDDHRRVPYTVATPVPADPAPTTNPVN